MYCPYFLYTADYYFLNPLRALLNNPNNPPMDTRQARQGIRQELTDIVNVKEFQF